MVAKIEIENFKGIKHRVKHFDKKLILVGGENGAGKSSFLQAIRYGLTGKTPTKEDILLGGAESGCVTLTFDDPDGTIISREFFADGKPTKVRVNGKTTTGKSAQELICSLLCTNDGYLDMNTSQDVFCELLKGELGKFLLGFVPEFFTPEKLFGIVEFSEAEKTELIKVLPESFGLDECEALYKDFYDRRASLKALVQKTESLLPEYELPVPVRSIEEVEKELASILAAEQIANAYAKSLKSYETNLSGYERRVAEIKALEGEFASIVVEEVNPDKKAELKQQQQRMMTAKATAQGNIRTLQSNIIMFEKTLEKLGTSVCPISERLVCTTDKTAAKAEFEALIAENRAAISKQESIIANADATLKTIAAAESELAEKERLVIRKNNLHASIENAKRLLGEPPVKPEPVSMPDDSRKPELLKAKEDIFKYNEYKKNKASYEKLSKELDVIASLTKKFAPKGIVTEGIIGFYCEIFTEEIETFADAVDYSIKFVPHKGLSLLVQPGTDKHPVFFENLSTGEQLITTVIIQHLCNTLSGSTIMLIDNFNDLDEKNATALQKMLKAFESEYSLLVATGINFS